MTYPFKCPKCGHMRLERIGDWEACERRQCGYEKVPAPPADALTKETTE